MILSVALTSKSHNIQRSKCWILRVDNVLKIPIFESLPTAVHHVHLEMLLLLLLLGSSHLSNLK